MLFSAWRPAAGFLTFFQTWNVRSGESGPSSGSRTVSFRFPRSSLRLTPASSFGFQSSRCLRMPVMVGSM